MISEPTVWSFVVNAGPVVKFVMLILLAASVMSWTFIFQRGLCFKQARLDIKRFEDQFWSGIDLNSLSADIIAQGEHQGLAGIFQAGFKEFLRLRQQAGVTPPAVLEGVQRAMRVTESREMERLEQHLSFLATVGSTSPYVGLFGTVWGIMTSFQALGAVQQATISMVAPGISEALIATAMGLFAAIPAVIAYNRFANDVDRLGQRYSTFQEEFSSILYRQAHGA